MRSDYDSQLLLVVTHVIIHVANKRNCGCLWFVCPYACTLAYAPLAPHWHQIEWPIAMWGAGPAMSLIDCALHDLLFCGGWEMLSQFVCTFGLVKKHFVLGDVFVWARSAAFVWYYTLHRSVALVHLWRDLKIICPCLTCVYLGLPL